MCINICVFILFNVYVHIQFLFPYSDELVNIQCLSGHGFEQQWRGLLETVWRKEREEEMF